MADLGLGQVEDDKNLDFKEKYDEDNEIYTDNLHSCQYFEMPEIKNKFMKFKDGFSSYSHQKYKWTLGRYIRYCQFGKTFKIFCLGFPRSLEYRKRLQYTWI